MSPLVMIKIQVLSQLKGENGKDGISINGKDGTIGLKGEDGKRRHCLKW